MTLTSRSYLEESDESDVQEWPVDVVMKVTSK